MKVNRAVIFLGVALCLLAWHQGAYAKINPADIVAVWTADDGNERTLTDVEGQGINGIITKAKWVPGLRGGALQFDGKSSAVKIPDSNLINTGGPFPKRTIMALFNCDDVSITDQKQTIYEEGGRTRGLVIYVYDGKVWVGGWNRAEYNWRGEWISAPVQSGKWHYVALILRDTTGKVEKDKFEMWLDGQLVEKRPGGQLHGHGDDIGIGHVNQNTVFHDEDGAGTNIHYFKGLIDEVRLYNASLTQDDLDSIWGGILAVRPAGKLATLWGRIKQ